MYPISLKTVTGAVLLAVLPTVALAGQPQGNWRGLIQQSNSDVALQVRFTADTVNVHFDMPFACDVTAKFLKEDAATTVYRFRPSINGGKFCDSLLNRDIRFTAAGEKALDLTFDGPRSTWRGKLSPAPSP